MEVLYTSQFETFVRSRISSRVGEVGFFGKEKPGGYMYNSLGVLCQILYWEALPQGPALTLLFNILTENATPLLYLFIEKSTPFTFFHNCPTL